MSIFGKIFGRTILGAPDNPRPSGGIVIRPIGRSIVSLPQIDMMGRTAASPSGRYRLVWRDSATRCGEVVGGRYVLLDGTDLLVDGAMDRPNDGKVADDGTFILNDWGSREALEGRFVAFARDGRVLVERHFAANLVNNGLSQDGRLAVCQTANAPGSPDNSILTIFDLAGGTVRAAWRAESGWASGYAFPRDGVIRMLRGDRIPLDYALGGEFLDRMAWLKDEVSSGNLHVIRIALEEGMQESGLLPADLRRGVLATLASDDRRFDADAWRLIGEIEESAGEARAALAAYDKALAINAKVGVAKRATSLRKALGGSPSE
jgi:hypothetical protein